VVLGFIGVKLVLHWGHTLSDAVPEIPTLLSLAVILVVLAITTVASLLKVRRDPAAKAHAGSVRAHPRPPEPESPPEPS
jgi:tellurite resistance protein TerC